MNISNDNQLNIRFEGFGRKVSKSEKAIDKRMLVCVRHRDQVDSVQLSGPNTSEYRQL